MTTRTKVSVILAALAVAGISACTQPTLAEYAPPKALIGSAEWDRADEDMTHFYSAPSHPAYRDEHARYLTRNPNIPAHTRRQAALIVQLWIECSDGENGYRSNWLRSR